MHKRPLIIIGAGRSGTSVLMNILDRHSQIWMIGELNRAPSRLYELALVDPQAVSARSNAIRHHARSALPIGSNLIDGSHAALQYQGLTNRRLNDSIKLRLRQLFEDIYGVNEHPKPFYGFKDLWIRRDDPHFFYVLQTYQSIFPDALFLHLVRNPYTYARSCSDFRNASFTLAALRESLMDWSEFIIANREFAKNGNYFFLTYEAVVADPETTLTPVLAQLGIAWEPNCLDALTKLYVPSNRKSAFPIGYRDAAQGLDELAEWMARLGYVMPDEPEGGTTEAVEAIDPITRTGTGRWRLTPPFEKEAGYSWLVELGASRDAKLLARLADTTADPEKSPLQLLEDGVPLPMAHSLHLEIREVGLGRYSHWNTQLIFSTTDNTNPNENSRDYSILIS